jgi:hypothetical protein
MKIIEHMKRVNAILRAAQDNPRLRKEVADQTSKYVRDKDPERDRNFEELLSKLERKLKIAPDTIAPKTPSRNRRGYRNRKETS